MILAESTVVFTVGFTLFVVAFVTLVVLAVRFTLQRGRIARRSWLVAHEAHRGGDSPSNIDGQRGCADADIDEDADEAADPPPKPITALVLSGGGTRGATQVGMLQVLAEGGFVPDRIYGASVGAINGSAFAGNPTVEGVEQLTQVWRAIRGDDVYPQRIGHGPWRFLQQRESIYANSGLRNIVQKGITFDRLEHAAVPFEVVATSIDDGRERWLTSGPAVEAVLASAAIPAIFPPVVIDGDRLIDGGILNNVPIGRAIDAGATRIVVLLCGPPTYSPAPTKRPVEAMLNALFISMQARFSRELSRLPAGVEVIVCSGATAASRDYTDFSDTEALMAAGRAEAVDVLTRHGVIQLRGPNRLSEAQ